MNEQEIVTFQRGVLDKLLAYKKEDVDFTFLLRRQKNDRLKAGYCFHGNEAYLALGFFNERDNKSRSPTINLNYSYESGVTFFQVLYRETKVAETFYDKVVSHLQQNSISYKIKYVSKGGDDKIVNFCFEEKGFDEALEISVKSIIPAIRKLIKIERLESDLLVTKEDLTERMKIIKDCRDSQSKNEKVLAKDIEGTEKAVEKGMNQILYGPPGTGKTYNTVMKAVDICRTDNDNFPSCDDHKDEGHQTKCYECAKEAYKLLKGKGRIEFVTFHQSYGYEEFIEGIRADTDEGGISYKKEDGVFKRLAINAQFDASMKEGEQSKSLGFHERYGKLVSAFNDDEELVLDSKTAKPIEVKTISKRGNLHCYHEGSDKRYTVSKDRLKKLYDQFDTLGKLNKVTNLNKEFSDVIGGANQTTYWSALSYMLKLQGGNNVKENCLEPSLDYDSKKAWLKEQDSCALLKHPNNYVLIIDEINRGNMSKIFGELITLIEDDKRLGKPNEMTVRLPVSGDEFGVPSNLYIIGTMNTADRSIAMMDTALRRRFEFAEMMPDAEVFDDFGKNGIINVQLKDDAPFELNLKDMLNKINQRIEVLYDREHTIGHAYFMPLKETPTIDKLSSVFKNKVIPLLAEYFFEDWEKIRMVLGDNQKGKVYPFIIATKQADKDLFFGEQGELNDESVAFERSSDALEKPDSYIGIYSEIKVKTEANPDSKKES